MNKIITHLDLDLTSSNEYKIINAQQLDNNTRRLEVNLFHEGKIYDISNVTKIELQGSRGDGLVIKTTLSHNGNTIIVDFDDTILGAKGLCKLKIALYNSGELLSSFPFIIRVDENVYDERGVIASPVYSELEETLDRVDILEETVTNNETIRNNNENTRKENETSRTIAENNRSKSENERVSSEETRVSSENIRLEAEKNRAKNESSRENAESLRLDAEESRIEAETIRNTKENKRITNEESRKTSETERKTSEQLRNQSESLRVASESERVANEKSRVTAESNRNSAEETRIDNENTRKESEQSRVLSEVGRVDAENARVTEFGDIKTKFTTISSEAKNMNVEAISSIDAYQVKVTNKNGESTTSPNLLSKIEIGNVETEMYDQEASASITGKFGEQRLNLKLPTGKPFKIKKSYKSIVEMNENIINDLDFGEFCMIDTGSVEDEDTAKLYMRNESGASFLTDLSGAQGIQGVKGDTGNTPNIEIGTVNTGEPDTKVIVTLSGTKEDPILNFTIPKGSKGDKGEPGKDATTSIATTSADGLMSSSDKVKLNDIEEGANKTIVDSALSSTSTNPVQNKVINTALKNKSNVDHEHTTVNGHTVEKDIFGNTGFTTTTNILTTIQTVTSNNVTCTLNEDGTYILDGTASALATFIINCTLNIGVYQLVGCPENGSLDTYSLICKKDNMSGAELAKDLGDGSQVNIIEQTNAVIYIRINKGYTCNNLVFKPMLTTDLQAKYSDYVPYTGNLGNLNADVSKIVQQLDGHTVNADVPSNAKFTDTDTWRPQPDWNATSGDSVIKNKPTSMPASDVYAWAKASSKPEYTKSEVGLGNVDNTADANKTVKNANAITGFTVVDRSKPSWGEFAQTAYTTITEWKSATEGGIAFADKDKTTSIQIDGYFYQNEGTYKVLDMNNFSDVAAKKNHTHTGLSNGDNYSIYGGNDTSSEVGGGLNNLVFSSWNGVSFTTNCTDKKYYNTTAVSINCRTGRLTANTVATASSMECSDMTIKTAKNGITLKNNYTYPARIFVDDKTLKIMTIGTSSGTTSNWGAGLAISTCAGGIYPIYNYKGTESNIKIGVNLGTASAKFGTIYCENTGSDKKLKKDINNLADSDLLNKYIEMYKDMDFVKFRWKNNHNSGLETPPSSRYHYGIIAQDIEKLLIEKGIGTYDNGIIQSSFFAENTSGAFVTGGYQPRFENKDNGITYDYSENVYNFKHGYNYEVYNEIVEKDFSEINSTGVYVDRNNISYIMIEDNSKLAEGNSRPPVTIKGIVLVDKDGNMKKLSMDYNKCISYYEWNDNDFSNPKTSGTLNEDGSITVSFNKKYGTYMIKVNDFNFFDYEKIILDVDYVGEYKVYLIPNATEEHVNANVWDRGRVDDIMLIYNVNYQELQIMCLFAAQQRIKQQESEISVLKSEIQEIKGLISNA